MRLAMIALVVALGCSDKGGRRVVAPPQTPTTATDPDALPLDPKVTTGRLPNGLTYYVLGIDKLYNSQTWSTLIVAAGTDDETPAQREAATKLADAIWRLQYSSENPQPRADVYFDHTTVRALATDLEYSMAELRKVADGIEWNADTFNDAAEEWEEWFREAKRPRGPDEPPYDPSARQAEQPGPFDAKTYGGVKTFYETWYRPDLMKIVVVTDDKPERAIAEITRAFSSMKVPAAPAPARKPGPARPAKPGLSIVMADAEDSTSLVISQRVPRRRARDERGYRTYIAEQAATDILGARIRIVSDGGAASIGVAAVDSHENELVIGAFATSADPGYALVLRELERMRIHGIEAGELAIWQARVARRAARDAARHTDPDATDADENEPHDGYESDGGNGLGVVFSVGDAANTADTPYLLERLVAHATGEIMYPGGENDLAIVKSLTSAEVSAAAATLLTSPSRTLTAGGDATLEAKLRAADAALRATPPPRWADAPHVRPLVTPAAGTITSERQVDGLAIYELGNGARAVVRRVENARGVTIYAFGPGGWIHLDPEAAFEHFVAPLVVLAGGLGDMTQPMVEDALRGRWVELNGTVWRHSHTLSAHGDLEIAAQALHLALTRPRQDRAGLGILLETPIDASEAAMVEVDRALDALEGDTIRPARTKAVLDNLDIARIYQAYVDHYGDMKSTTFAVVGDVDPAAAKQVIATYLASIPSSGTRITAKRRAVAKRKIPSTVAGNPTATVVEYIAAPVTKDFEQVECDLDELTMLLTRRLPGASEVYAGLTTSGRKRLLRITVRKDPPVSPQEIQKVIDELGADPKSIADQLAPNIYEPEHFVFAVESAFIRGGDPVAAMIYFDRRYAKPLSDSGLKAAAKLFKKPTVIVKGTK